MVCTHLRGIYCQWYYLPPLNRYRLKAEQNIQNPLILDFLVPLKASNLTVVICNPHKIPGVVGFWTWEKNEWMEPTNISPQNGRSSSKPSLVGGWTNPFEKYARQIGSFPQIGLKIKKYLSCQPLVHFYVFHVSFREGWPWFPLRMLQSCGFVVLLLVRFQCLVNINQTRTHFGFLLVWIWSTQQRKWCKLLQAKQTLKSQPPLYQNQGNILGNLRAQTITSIKWGDFTLLYEI